MYLRIVVLLCLCLIKSQAEIFYEDQTITRIAFGSCNKTHKDQSYWNTVARQQPDLWIWLGDNIYGDTKNMHLLSIKYKQQKNDPHYQSFRQEVPVIGIWDDHDYGVNDGNKTFPMKHESKELFMDFMEVPFDSPAYERPGIYQSYTYGAQGQRIKFILLDTRTFQDPLKKRHWGAETTYHANTEGQILGNEQWQWLADELHNSDADINIIANSLQVIAQDHRFEMWYNFPNERKRLLDLVVDSQVSNPIFLSGDRHMSEISSIEWRGQKFYDVTSSGLTHAFLVYLENNRHREGPLITNRSFARMDFDWFNREILVNYISPRGKKYFTYAIEMR